MSEGPLPSLEALCSDLTSATSINRALTQVFLLMAQGRISQKQAVAFGYLTQLLLQTVPGVRAEFVSAYGYASWEENLKASLELTIRPGSSSRPPAKVYPQDELSPVNKVKGSEGPLSDPDETVEPKKEAAAPAASATLKKHHLTPEAIYEGLTPADFESLYARSLDLFDRKFDFTPEGRREKQILNYELELIKPPDTKPPKGHVGEVVKLARRFKQELNPDPAKRVARDFYGNPIPPADSWQSDHPTRSSGESHLLPRKGYQQDALFAGNEDELSPAKKVIPSEKLERGISPNPFGSTGDLTPNELRQSGTLPNPLAASTHMAYVSSALTPPPASPAGVILSESATADERTIAPNPLQTGTLPPYTASPASTPAESDGDGYYSSEAYRQYCKTRDPLKRNAHTTAWFAPVSWSGPPQPDPYP